MALKLLPGDSAIAKEQKAICELTRMSSDELQEYREKCYERSSPEAFRKIIGYTVEEIDDVLAKMREQEEYEDALDLD